MESVRMSTSPRPLPADIIIAILNKVTLKILHRLKWVSKSWFSLIINEVLAPSNLCIFYRYYHNLDLFLSCVNLDKNPMLEKEISMSLIFLPNNYNEQSPDLSIIDCCNGLVFCCNRHSLIEKSYFVCNPVEKTYDKISFIDPLSCYILDFNPLESSYYKLIAFKATDFSNVLKFLVYYSEKQCSGKVVSVILPRLIHVQQNRSSIALWNGNVYCHAVDLGKENENKVIVISGVLEESAKNISYKFINFPERSCMGPELCSYMDTWRGELRYVSIHAERIRVWALRDNQQDKWMLEHCTAGFLICLGEELGTAEDPYIVGFHPVRNVLFIMFQHLLYAYDFDQMRVENFCEFLDGDVYDRSVFSFYPCFAKKLLASP